MRHLVDGQHVGRGAHHDLLFQADPEHVVKRPQHDPLQPIVDVVLIPEKLLQILDPLEIRNSDATGVGQDIRDDEHPLVVEDLVGLGSGRAIGSLADDLGLDPAGVSLVDLVFQRGRHQHGDGQLQQLFIGDELADFLPQAPVQLLLADDLVELDAAFVVAGAVRVADGDDLAAGLGEQFGGGVADITDALDRDGRVLRADL